MQSANWLMVLTIIESSLILLFMSKSLPSRSNAVADAKVVAAATSVLERLATIRTGRVQVVTENVSLLLSGLLSHSDASVRSAAIAALRVASDSIEGRRTLASYDDVAKLLTQSLCGMDPVDGAFY